VTAVVDDPSTAAAASPTWTALVDRVVGCVACPELAAARRHVVPGDCPPGAELLLVGEAPGAQEDAAGRPFVGRAGQLLEQVLDEAGLSRDCVAVANVLKCRPPGNRRPTRAEAGRCRPWLDRQVQLVDPLLVVAMGATAVAWALGPAVRLGASRGELREVAGRPLLVTYHPSAALRFGPGGVPMAALRQDLAWAAGLLPGLRRPAEPW